MVSFPDAVKLFFQRYTDFKGRSRRSEYWWVALFNILVLIIPYGILVSIGGLIDGELNLIGMIMAAIVGLYALAIIVPSIAKTRAAGPQPRSTRLARPLETGAGV